MGAAAGGAGYSMTNQGTSGSDATTKVGGIGGINLNLSSAGLNKGIPPWVIAVAVVAAAFIAYKVLK